MRKESGNKKGYTIIEVTLVIAIAGLIFLMVFVALPSLQRLARDSQRKEDVTKLMNTIKKYESNNRGIMPTNADQLRSYLGDFADPSGRAYTVVWPTKNDDGGFTYSGSAMDYKMYVIPGTRCDSEGAVAAENPRKIAIIYRLEGSGVYCSDM